MFKFLGRCVMFVLGAVLLFDVGMPTSLEMLQVDRHTSSTESASGSARNSTWADTSYTLHLIGGRTSSCSVGYSAYGRLKDGETIGVKSTKLFKSCIQITKDSEVIEASTYWRLIGVVAGCLLIAAALGWVETDDDDGFPIR